MKILYSSLIFLGIMTQTSVQSEFCGEDLFLGFFGLDSTSSCELCNDWTQASIRIDASHMIQKWSADVEDILQNLSFQFKQLTQLDIPFDRYGIYLIIFCCLSILLLLVLKVRTKKRPYGYRLKCHEMQNHKSRKTMQKLSAEKDSWYMKSSRKGQDSDKLRKTKKQRPHMFSKQGLTILKNIQQGSEDNSTFDVITQERCRLVSFDPEFSTDNMQVFDLREPSDVPHNVMDALLCVERNCTTHPHNYIKKYGYKIVCNQEAFSLKPYTRSYQPEKLDSENVEYIFNSDDADDRFNGAGDNVDGTRYDDLGPPCASSSFISNSSSVTITSDQDGDDAYDPFSFLDETSSPNTSVLQKYLEDSMTWFGGLYSYTRETSFGSFTADGLNRSISRSLVDLDKSFDVSELQKSLSLSGYESDSVIQLGAIYFAKQIIGQIKHTWLQLGANKTKKSIVEYNRSMNREVDCSGCAVYNDSVYDE